MICGGRGCIVGVSFFTLYVAVLVTSKLRQKVSYLTLISELLERLKTMSETNKDLTADDIVTKSLLKDVTVSRFAYRLFACSFNKVTVPTIRLSAFNFCIRDIGR